MLVLQGPQGVKGVCGVQGLPVSLDIGSNHFKIRMKEHRVQGSPESVAEPKESEGDDLLCLWFQGLDTLPGIKGEKGIVGFPGPRVNDPPSSYY